MAKNKKVSILEKIIRFLDKKSFLFVILLVFVCSVLYSTISIIRHIHYQSGAYDLGIFDQALWQYSHFLYPFNTIKMRMILGDHFTLLLPFLAPLYWVWDDVRMLLLFQAVWVSLSAIPIYKYLLLKKFRGFESFLLTLLYILFYGAQFGIFFDFHPVMIAFGLIGWIIYFWESGRMRLFWVGITLLLATQENMAFAILGLIAIWVFEKKKIKMLLILSVLCLLYLFVSLQLVRFFAGGFVEYVPHFPSQIQGYITSFFDQEEKRQVWFFGYTWYSFLPVFSIGSTIAVLLNLFQYFVVGGSPYWSPLTHHHVLLGVFLFLGLVQTLQVFRSKRIYFPVILLLVLPILLQFRFHFVLNKLAKKDFYKSEPWVSDNNTVIKHISPKASLVTQQSIVPHVSHRNYIYLLYPVNKDFKNAQDICGQKSCWWFDFAGRPQYLMVDDHPSIWLTMALADANNFSKAITNMESTGVIQLIFRQRNAKLYKIDYVRLNNIH